MSRIGMCVKCKEYTDVTEPCCNSGVWFEGSVYTLDDLEEQDHTITSLEQQLKESEQA